MGDDTLQLLIHILRTNRTAEVLSGFSRFTRSLMPHDPTLFTLQIKLPYPMTNHKLEPKYGILQRSDYQSSRTGYLIIVNIFNY
jgi:hypothetical protein